MRSAAEGKFELKFGKETFNVFLGREVNSISEPDIIIIIFFVFPLNPPCLWRLIKNELQEV